jgi:hypothetical protein
MGPPPGVAGTWRPWDYRDNLPDDEEGSPPLGVGPKAPRPMAPPIGGGYTLERLVGGVTIPLPVPLGYVLPGWPPILGVLRRNLPRKLGECYFPES